MNFGEVLKDLKVGKTVSRGAWGGKRWVYLDAGKAYFLTDEGSEGYWIPLQKDIFAEDWGVTQNERSGEVVPVVDLRVMGET